MLPERFSKRSHAVRIFAHGQKQKLSGFGIDKISHVGVAFFTAGLIHRDVGDLTPIALPMGDADEVIDDSPEPGVVLTHEFGNCGDRHLRDQSHRHGLEHEGESASLAGPRNGDLADATLAAFDTRNLCREFGLVLPEVEVPPGAFPAIMDATTRGGTVRAVKLMGTLLKIHGENQSFGIAFKAALTHNPWRVERKGGGK